MSLYALHANALRPLVAKFRGRQFRSDDDMREFVDDLLNALQSREPIQLADTLRLAYDGSGAALVVEGDEAWKECPLKMIPAPDDCQCDWGCCCDGEFTELLDSVEEDTSGEPVGPLTLTISGANPQSDLGLNGEHVLNYTPEGDTWSTGPLGEAQAYEFRMSRRAGHYTLGLYTIGSTMVTAQVTMDPIFFMHGGVDDVFSAEVTDPDE